MTEQTAQSLPSAGTYVVDPSHTEVSFVARHAMVTKVRGYFRDVEGTIEIGEDFADSKATATMQTASIDTGSVDRDGHLKSADFFDVENNPTITFTSTGVQNVSDNTFELVGDLTIGGVTRQVVLQAFYDGTAQDPFGNVRSGFTATTIVERENWDLNWNAALETGGVLVSKKITLNLEISAIKQG